MVMPKFHSQIHQNQGSILADENNGGMEGDQYSVGSNQQQRSQLYSPNH